MFQLAKIIKADDITPELAKGKMIWLVASPPFMCNSVRSLSTDRLLEPHLVYDIHEPDHAAVVDADAVELLPVFGENIKPLGYDEWLSLTNEQIEALEDVS